MSEEKDKNFPDVSEEGDDREDTFEGKAEISSGKTSARTISISESQPDGLKSIKKKIQKELRKFSQRKKQYKDLPQDNAAEAPDDLTSKQCDEQSELDRATYIGSVKPSLAQGKQGEEISTESPQREEYDFTHTKRGIAALVIYTEFQNLRNRKSADYDFDHMFQIFHALEFDVKWIKNAKTVELLKWMADIRDSIQKSGINRDDCFACVISSHGAEVQKPSSDIREHVIYTYDGLVKTNDLLEMFSNSKCKALRGKPKLFFIQACRGVLPEDPGRQEIDLGVHVHVTENTRSERVMQHQFWSRKDAPEKGKLQEEASGIESKPDIRQNYGEYYPTTQKPTVAEQCQTAMEDLASITERIQERTMLTTGHNNRQQNIQYQETAQIRHQAQKGQFINTSEIRFADEEYDNVQGMRTHTYNVQKTTYQTKISPPVFKPLDFCSLPVFNDFLVMFSAASGTIAWSDGDKGGWLLFCLYNLAKALRKTFFKADLLEILIDTAGKMAREIQAHSSDPRYEGAKAAAVVNHRLRKEIYLTPKNWPCGFLAEV